MLIHRPSPKLGESWSGYLLRISSLNRMHGIAELAKISGTSANKILVTTPNQVMEKFGLYGPCDLVTSSTLPMQRNAKRWSHRRSLKSRLCVKCIEGPGNFYIRASWEREFQLDCPSHRIFLLDKCPKCKTRISNDRKYLDRCDCEYIYKNSKLEESTINLDNFLRFFELDRIYGMDAPTFDVNRALDNSVRLFCDRLLHKKAERIMVQNSEFMSLKEMQAAAQIFESWPANFLMFVDANMSTSFGEISDDLFAEPVRGLQIFAKIKIALKKHLDLNKKIVWQKWRDAQFLIFPDSYFENLEYLKTITKCSDAIVNYWIQSGWLKDVRYEQLEDGTTVIKVFRQKAKAIADIVRYANTAQEISSATGLSEDSIHTLAKAKFTDFVPLGPGEKNLRFVPRDFFDFARSAFTASKLIKNNNTSYVPISEIIVQLGTSMPHLVSAFVLDVICNRITLTKDSITSELLTQVSMPLEKFVEWRNKAILVYADT